MPRPRVVLSLLFVLLAIALAVRPAVLVLGSTHRTAEPAPTPNRLPADKQGFGTSRTLASKVWFTSGLVDRHRASGRAAVDRGLPLRAQVRLNHNTGR